jgi:hypothetical protein
MNNRKIDGTRVVSPGDADVFTYSGPAGARKSTEVGRKLIPIPTPAASPAWTTNIATAVAIQPGKNIAVYNNANAMGSITFGSAGTVASLAAGAVDANGNVGLPCPPNSWSYFASGESNFMISSAATMLVFLIADDTYIAFAANPMPPSGFFQT